MLHDPANKPVLDMLKHPGNADSSGVLSDSSFIQHLDPRLAEPFKRGFADSMHTVFLMGAIVVALAFLLMWFIKEVPLRQISGLQARAQADAEAEAAAASAGGVADAVDGAANGAERGDGASRRRRPTPPVPRAPTPYPPSPAHPRLPRTVASARPDRRSGEPYGTATAGRWRGPRSP